jgi:DNA replication and repair protein RecF
MNLFFHTFASMYLKSLQLLNFKNYEEAEFQFSSGINCLTGKNGSGKTNVLDAVHYLSMCKSYLNAIDRQNIRFEQPFLSIVGDWEKNEQSIQIHCAIKNGAKKVFKRNKKEYEKLADHIGQFPSVFISPYDRDLIVEGSEYRRKWMDGIVSQFDRRYLDNLQRYHKVLEQRNALLKNMYKHGLFDRESMEVWDEQLVNLGSNIHEGRKSFLDEFIPIFQKYYSFLGEHAEEVTLEYRSQLNENNFVDLLVQNQQKDTFSQYTNAGTHKDDLLFMIKDNPIKKFGSQGQQKSFLIALKLAQFEWLKMHLNTTPVLLLDDIFDKLDDFRVERLMTLVAQNTFGQVLVTDTSSERLQQVFHKNGFEVKHYAIDSGRIVESELEIIS